MLRRVTCGLLGLLVGLLLLPSEAAIAAYPGANGRIAYVSKGDVHSVRRDFTGIRRLTFSQDARAPHWSPDGRQLAYVRGNQAWLMRADGTGKRALAGTAGARELAWAPDGRRIAFLRVTGTDPVSEHPLHDVFIVPTAGGQATRLTHRAARGCGVSNLHWSSNPRHVFFDEGCPAPLVSGIVMHDLQTGTRRTILRTDASWSVRLHDVHPDGQHLAVGRRCQEPDCNFGEHAQNLVVVDLSGRVTAELWWDCDCANAYVVNHFAFAPDGGHLLEYGGCCTVHSVGTTEGYGITTFGDQPFGSGYDWQPVTRPRT